MRLQFVFLCVSLFFLCVPDEGASKFIFGRTAEIVPCVCTEYYIEKSVVSCCFNPGAARRLVPRVRHQIKSVSSMPSFLLLFFSFFIIPLNFSRYSVEVNQQLRDEASK